MPETCNPHICALLGLLLLQELGEPEGQYEEEVAEEEGAQIIDEEEAIH